MTRGAELATCSYCSTTSRVSRPPPEAPIPDILRRSSQPPVIEQPIVYPEARRGLGSVARLFGTLATLAAVGMGVWTAAGGGRGLFSGPSSVDGLAAPLLADVDGDGVRDAVARSRYVSDGDRMHFAAFSGVDGHLLWESKALGSYNDVYQDRVMLAGDQLVVGELRGSLSAWRLRDGNLLWRTELGERTENGCVAGEGTVLVLTTDKRWHSVSLADGRSTDAAAPDVCVPLAAYSNVNPRRADVEERERWERGSELPSAPSGMSLDHYVRRRPEGPWIALGTRSPGTRAPLLARMADGAAVWTTVVPERPMEAEESAPEHVWLSEDSVVTIYKTGAEGTLHLARFAVSNGMRLWATAIPTGSMGVPAGISGDSENVWVAIWGRVECFDLATGAHRFTVGK